MDGTGILLKTAAEEWLACIEQFKDRSRPDRPFGMSRRAFLSSQNIQSHAIDTMRSMEYNPFLLKGGKTMEQEPIAGYGWYIKRIGNALAKEAAHNMQTHTLTMQQAHALVTLKRAPDGSLTLKELEEHFCAAQSTVAGLVARLEKKGLVEGYADPSDKRVKRVRLTDAGLSMNETCRQDVVASEKRLVSQLTEEEKASFLTLLRKVYDAVK